MYDKAAAASKDFPNGPSSPFLPIFPSFRRRARVLWLAVGLWLLRMGFALIVLLFSFTTVKLSVRLFTGGLPGVEIWLRELAFPNSDGYALRFVLLVAALIVGCWATYRGQSVLRRELRIEHTLAAAAKALEQALLDPAVKRVVNDTVRRHVIRGARENLPLAALNDLANASFRVAQKRCPQPEPLIEDARKQFVSSLKLPAVGC